MDPQHDGPITLSPEDYYRLEAAQGRVSTARLELMLTLRQLEAEVKKATDIRNVVVAAMAEKYGFAKDISYQPDEATHSLVPAKRPL